MFVGSVVAIQFNPIIITNNKNDFRSVGQPVKGESNWEAENSSDTVKWEREIEKKRDRERESGLGLVTGTSRVPGPCCHHHDIKRIIVLLWGHIFIYRCPEGQALNE